MCGNVIKDVDKCNVTAACPMFFGIENCECVTKFHKNNDERSEWTKVVEKKVKGTEQHRHAGANEKEIIEEMTKDMIKCFNDD